MTVHVDDAADTYNSIIIIRTVDSDVLVLVVYVFGQLATKRTVGRLATDKHYRLIPKHTICAAIGRDKCIALLMFHACSGCDMFLWVFLEEVSERYIKYYLENNSHLLQIVHTIVWCT